MSNYILQVCHSYKPPFADIARQYVSFFNNTDYRIITVYLTGYENADIAAITGGEVLFCGLKSKDLAGLKLKAIRYLKKLCAQHEFSFAIAHRFKPVYICGQVPGLKVIGVHHHAQGDYAHFMRRVFANSHIGRLFLLGVSNSVRSDLRTSLPRFNETDICTLHNSVDFTTLAASQIDKASARKALKLPEARYIFGQVGRLHPDKNQSCLLQAFAEVAAQTDNAILAIVGKGRLEQQLKSEAAALGITERVIFTGQIDNAASYFKAFDSFILPSYQEAFGLVLLEAICAELPIVASRVGGITEVLEDNEFLFTSGDSKQLAQRLLRVFQLSANEKEVISQINLQRATNNFSVEAVKKQFWQLPFMKNLTTK